MKYVDTRIEEIYCTFCGEPAKDAKAIVAGPDEVYICEECVAACAESISQELDLSLERNVYGVLEWGGGSVRDDGARRGGSISRPQKEKHTGSAQGRRRGLPSPQELYDHLCESVVGQESAKRVLSVAVYNHYKRLMLEGSRKSGSARVAKSNVMLVGPSGSGKTLLAQTLADKMQVPFAIADATVLTEAGYVGEDVENILLKLIQAADFDIERAETGIIYIDEIDKIACQGRAMGRGTRDVSGEGVQQALLKIIEGTDAAVPPKGGQKDNKDAWLHIDTTNILFILGGAFVGIDEIVTRRTGSQGIGFNGSVGSLRGGGDGLFEEVLPEDFSEFGMIPELIGRVPVVAALSPLTESDLVRILTEPKDSLVSQYQELFAYELSRLSFTDGALKAMAREALGRGTGARGLRAICERVLLDVMFELPNWNSPTRVKVTARDVLGETKPAIVAADGRSQVEVMQRCA